MVNEEPSGDGTDISGFATDCMNLWRAGHVYLPTVANAYALASQYLSYTYERVDEETTFSNRRGSGKSLAYDDWRDLRDLTQAILGRTAQNLYDVGTVLKKSALAFAAADTDNATALGTVVDQLDHLIDTHDAEVAEDLVDEDWDDLADAPGIPVNPDIPDTAVVAEILPEDK
ncbi:hypothetical protein LX16_4213 [Stackebrandtia albiflava]|uniref:Uncharacterized protein n=1 Tax=Stackebrandtia albiflava TaxID=406432 RepID=A0A562UYV7_9ACTN|nr:hypothetical protein [Stackebrandtia albiflava]TWJ10789.1 hypothetical protein LX16_4213 [Stackebrandtia albiflava]